MGSLQIIASSAFSVVADWVAVGQPALERESRVKVRLSPGHGSVAVRSPDVPVLLRLPIALRRHAIDLRPVADMAFLRRTTQPA